MKRIVLISFCVLLTSCLEEGILSKQQQSPARKGASTENFDELPPLGSSNNDGNFEKTPVPALDLEKLPAPEPESEPQPEPEPEPEPEKVPVENADCGNLQHGQSQTSSKVDEGRRSLPPSYPPGIKLCYRAQQTRTLTCNNGETVDSGWVTTSVEYVDCPEPEPEPETVPDEEITPEPEPTPELEPEPVPNPEPTQRPDLPSAEGIKFKKLVVSDGGVNKVRCAISEGDDLWCWGDNNYGQVGIGSVEKTFARPQKVLIPEKVIDVSPALKHTCAITVSHKLYCWGSNQDLPLGRGKLCPEGTCDSNKPVHIKKAIIQDDFWDTERVFKDLPLVKTIRTDYGVSCVLTVEDILFCSGLSSGYSQGAGRYFQSEGYFERINGGKLAPLYKFKELFISGISSCGLGSDNHMYCWGNNMYFQAGICVDTFRVAPELNAQCYSEGAYRGSVLFPYPAMSLPFSTADSLSVSMNDRNTFFLSKNQGDLYYMGQNPDPSTHGRRGWSPYFRPIKLFPEINKHFVETSAGTFTHCARSDDSRVYCGSLGSTGNVSGREAVAASNLRPLSIHVVGDSGLCVLSENGGVYCSSNAYASTFERVE